MPQARSYTPPASVAQTTETAPAARQARGPDYKADGVALWVNDREDGSKYVSIKVAALNTVYANEVKAEDRRTTQKGRSPDFSGNGVAVWFETAKSGVQYASIRIVGCESVAAFLNEEKPAAAAPSS